MAATRPLTTCACDLCFARAQVHAVFAAKPGQRLMLSYACAKLRSFCARSCVLDDGAVRSVAATAAAGRAGGRRPPGRHLHDSGGGRLAAPAGLRPGGRGGEPSICRTSTQACRRQMRPVTLLKVFVLTPELDPPASRSCRLEGLYRCSPVHPHSGRHRAACMVCTRTRRDAACVRLTGA